MLLASGELFPTRNVARHLFDWGTSRTAVAAAADVFTVEVTQHVVIDFARNFFLFQHFLDGFSCGVGLDGLAPFG